MQKLSLFVLFGLVLLASSIVVAEQARSGIVYDIEIPLTGTVVKIVNEGDVLRFNFPVRVYEDIKNAKGDYKLEDKAIKLHIREIIGDKLVKTTLFIPGEKVPVYLDVPNNRVLKVDFEKDGIQDMAIVFVASPDVKKVQVALKRNPSANYCNDNGVCEDDEDPQCGDCTGKVTSDVVKETNKGFINGYGKYIVGIVAGLIFFLVAYFFVAGRNSVT